MATRNRRLRQDTRGRFTTDLGRKISGGGKLAPHRFVLGTDEAEAGRRAAKLKLLWAAIETSHEAAAWGGGAVAHAYGIAADERAAKWTPDTFALAKQVAEGAASVVLPRNGDDPAAYARRFNATAARFPFLLLLPDEPDMYRVSD